MIDLKRLLPGRKNEDDAEAPAENPKKPKKKLLIGILTGVVVVGAGAYMSSLYLFPATGDYSAASGEFPNTPSELFGPPAGDKSPPSPPLPSSGGEPGGFSEDRPRAPVETLGAVASGAPQSPDAGVPAGPVAPSEDPAAVEAMKEPLPEAAAEKAAKMGRKIYDLQYDVEVKRLQLELAKLDAEIAEQNMKTLPPMIDKAEDSESDESPKPGLAPDMLPMLSAVGNPGGGQEKGAAGLTAITGDKAIIDGKVVRVGGVYNGMKVVSINPRLGLVKLRSPIGGAEIELSL